MGRLCGGKDGDAHDDAIWHDGSTYSPIVSEVSRACPRPMLPTRADPGRTVAAPASGATSRSRVVGGRRGPGPAAAVRARWSTPWSRWAMLPRRRGSGCANGPTTAAERAAPCATSLDVEACFAPLLRWVLGVVGGETICPWPSTPPASGQRWVVIAISVLYRGRPSRSLGTSNQDRGAARGSPPCRRCWPQLAPAVPRHHAGAGPDRSWVVESPVVAQYQGFWLASGDAHPPRRHLCPARASRGVPRAPSCPVPATPGSGTGTAFKHRDVRRAGHPGRRLGRRAAPNRGWCLTDLPPQEVGVALVRPAGVGRTGLPGAQELRLALGAHAAGRCGTRGAALAGAGGRHPGERRLRHPGGGCPLRTGWRRPTCAPHARHPRSARGRTISLVRPRGRAWLQVHLLRRRPLWRRLWLVPHALPEPPTDLVIVHHPSCEGVAA